MTESVRPMRLFMIRYKHNREVIDITGRGETGKDAFDRYVGRMTVWGNNARDYKFISARQIPELDGRGEK